ncbi:MAG: translation initiation factor IF-6 [Candidatus Bathyarchaeia archaeon]|nr:translation initiation factor IF-6 [Candidatus Bathyarchaeota archaeon]
MPIFLLDVFGSASIGVFMRVTERVVIVPNQFPESRIKRIESWFKIPVIRTNIGGSVLIGSLVCANSNGIVLPHFVRDEELSAFKALGKDINITIMEESKRTAFGNLVLSNDYGAIADPRLKRNEIKLISDTLGVEVVEGEIAGSPYVGSLAFATNRGVLAHPLLKPEEEKLLSEVLKTQVSVGTVNCGIPYVGTGLVGNSTVVVAGSLTTGPELFIIGQALKVVGENE